MIKVTFLNVLTLNYTYVPTEEPRLVDATHVDFHDGFACFWKDIPVEGEKWPASQFVEAIRADRIDGLVRVSEETAR